MEFFFRKIFSFIIYGYNFDDVVKYLFVLLVLMKKKTTILLPMMHKFEIN